jgi:glycosyltransferase involved in cell wall biosynthesis
VPKKITYIVSDINKALAFEWLASFINKEKFHLSFILLNPGTSELERYLHQHQIEVYHIKCRGKKDWITAIFKTYKLLRIIRPEIVHCHLIQANIIGLFAARSANVKKRIYTRHHSSYHHVYFPKGVWWDKLANRLATHIVAISGIVKKILLEWEKVPATKIYTIPHGFSLKEFDEVAKNRMNDFKLKNKLAEKYPVVGVISRFNELKGVQYIIPAFKDLLLQYPNAVLLLLNAFGDYEKTIMECLKIIPESSYRLIKFEKDIAAAYHAMDVFVHVPIDEHSEAFGQIYIEALAAGVPAVFTRSGIANELYFNDSVAYIVDYKNPDQIFNAMLNIFNDRESKKKN